MGNDKTSSFSNDVVSTYGDTLSWEAGQSGYGNALELDGSSVVTMQNSGYSDAAGTMEAWVRFAANANAGLQTVMVCGFQDYHLLSVYCDGNSNYSVGYHTYDHSGDGTGNIGSSQLSANVWYHVLATHNASTGQIQLFINGQSQGTASYTPTLNPGEGGTLELGAWWGGGSVAEGFQGDIDEVRISSSIRYTSNFTPPTQPYTADANTTLLTHLDSTSGSPELVYLPSQWNLLNVPLPHFFDEQATCYAVEEFLDRDCGVEWFNPTPTGSYYPSTSTLIVAGSDVLQTPASGMRIAGSKRIAPTIRITTIMQACRRCMPMAPMATPPTARLPIRARPMHKSAVMCSSSCIGWDTEAMTTCVTIRCTDTTLASIFVDRIFPMELLLIPIIIPNGLSIQRS